MLRATAVMLRANVMDENKVEIGITTLILQLIMTDWLMALEINSFKLRFYYLQIAP